MMRSSRASSPVVSVSKMISRIESLRPGNSAHLSKAAAMRGDVSCPAFRRQRVDDAAHLLPRRLHPAAGVDDEIGAAALFRVGHLLCQDRLEFFARSCPAAQHALALDIRRRGHDRHLVDAVPAAGFEKQWDVEHDQRRALAAVVAPRKQSASARTSGWTIRFQRLHRRRIAHALREPVSRGRPHRLRSCRETPLRPAAPPRRHRADAPPRRNRGRERRPRRTFLPSSTFPCRSNR